MKTDAFTKVMLSVIAVLLVLNLLASFGSRSADAVQAVNGRGKYQVSSWAVSIGKFGRHTGYYVLDTVTGKIVESHDDVIDATEEVRREQPTPR